MPLHPSARPTPYVRTPPHHYHRMPLSARLYAPPPCMRSTLALRYRRSGVCCYQNFAAGFGILLFRPFKVLAPLQAAQRTARSL
eukprot:685559-Rhodomonas_salina.3